MAMIFLIFVVSGCATARIKEHVDKIIDPSSSYEECVELLPTQTLVYLFKASEPVKFNINYNDGNTVMYPVSQGRISSWWDTFKPEKEENFCLTWENTRSYHITLYFEYEIRDRK
ncbi:MAG TPA: hypothetical protein ENG95_04305 [Nitrospirae bacterium]|nr:hypothetical protein [Nitrospirota bacterium]HDK17463.1 hypothetical protein [Nitrospirota bacterium]HDK81206.1 hypothetical protein [Nitrospirota bacterium]HDO25846.1 hypothetical protein [Nitrospirota bacterium]